MHADSAAVATVAAKKPSSKGHVLLVDDETLVLHAYSRSLTRAGFTVQAVNDSRLVPAMLQATQFDVVICDIAMPAMDGIQVLRRVREHDPDLPVVLVTGGAALESALKAIEHGALRYLVKPVEVDVLRRVADEAVRLRRVAHLKKQAFELYGFAARASADRDAQTAKLTQALGKLWMAYQPIVRCSARGVAAYEALVRTDDPRISNPKDLFDVAEELARTDEVGRVIRRKVAGDVQTLPSDVGIFVNLHPRDLLDEDLFDPNAPLSRLARRVTLEITERASLSGIRDIRARLAALRKIGFRIAIDDLGAGYSGLSAFAEIEPEVVKLDMALVRGIDREPTKRKLVHSMVTLCQELGICVVAEGIELQAERDTLTELGCDLLQGYLFGRPERVPRSVDIYSFGG